MHKRRFLSLAAGAALAGTTVACSTTSPDASSDPAAQRRSIDAKVDEALGKLYDQVPGSKELASKAKGILVFPSVVSAGFVVGGSYGKGALRKGSRTAGYYSTTAASVGLLAGAQSRAVYLLFMNDEVLNKFETSQGWTAGVDATVTVADASATAAVDTKTAQKPIVGYVLAGGGLMANLSFDGTKITKLEI
ncbi:MAG: YSC84-related protein [Rhizobacter sp.]